MCWCFSSIWTSQQFSAIGRQHKIDKGTTVTVRKWVTGILMTRLLTSYEIDSKIGDMLITMLSALPMHRMIVSQVIGCTNEMIIFTIQSAQSQHIEYNFLGWWRFQIFWLRNPSVCIEMLRVLEAVKSEPKNWPFPCWIIRQFLAYLLMSHSVVWK